jgi:hypothetical protein
MDWVRGQRLGGGVLPPRRGAVSRGAGAVESVWSYGVELVRVQVCLNRARCRHRFARPALPCRNRTGVRAESGESSALGGFHVLHHVAVTGAEGRDRLRSAPGGVGQRIWRLRPCCAKRPRSATVSHEYGRLRVRLSLLRTHCPPSQVPSLRAYDHSRRAIMRESGVIDKA